MLQLLKAARNRYRLSRIPDRDVYERPFYRPFHNLDSRIDIWRRVIFDRRLRRIYDRTTNGIDRNQYQALQEKYYLQVALGECAGTAKYLDLAPWIRLHSKIALQLDLDKRPRSSVLDIGSGGGHFLAVAKAHGHEVAALDLPHHEIYSDLLALFDIPRITGGVYLGKPLPKDVGRYDVITINAPVFDKHIGSQCRWDVSDWFEFLEYLTAHHLNFPGQIFVGLNKSTGTSGKQDYLWALVDAARQLGARNKANTPQFHFTLQRPLMFDRINP